jgi:hypothetical protein
MIACQYYFSDDPSLAVLETISIYYPKQYNFLCEENFNKAAKNNA